MQTADLQRKLKPRSKRARRILERREPKLVCALAEQFCAQIVCWGPLPSLLLSIVGAMQVEDIKKALLLNSGKVSQVTKDVLSDFRKLKGVRASCGKNLLYPCEHGMRGYLLA